jgi:hypothetical protein
VNSPCLVTWRTASNRERYDDAKWAEVWNEDKVAEGWALIPLDPCAPERVGEGASSEPRTASVATPTKRLPRCTHCPR